VHGGGDSKPGYTSAALYGMGCVSRCSRVQILAWNGAVGEELHDPAEDWQDILPGKMIVIRNLGVEHLRATRWGQLAAWCPSSNRSKECREGHRQGTSVTDPMHLYQLVNLLIAGPTETADGYASLVALAARNVERVFLDEQVVHCGNPHGKLGSRPMQLCRVEVDPCGARPCHRRAQSTNSEPSRRDVFQG